MDSAVSDLVVIIKQQAGFVSARPQWDCLLEVCKEIVKKNPKNFKWVKRNQSRHLSETDTISSSCSERKGALRSFMDLHKQHSHLVLCWAHKAAAQSTASGAGWNKTASSSSKTLTALLELRFAPETCSKCNSSTPGSEMLSLPPCSGTQPWGRGSKGCSGRHKEGHWQWEPRINPFPLS